MVVMVEAMIAPLTSDAPFMAASFTDKPLSWFLKIFSITTIALSTSIPAPNASPPRVIIFSVRSAKYIILKVAMIEMGIARLMIRVVPKRLRKMKRTKMAITIPIRAVCLTSFMAEIIKYP